MIAEASKESLLHGIRHPAPTSDVRSQILHRASAYFKKKFQGNILKQIKCMEKKKKMFSASQGAFDSRLWLRKTVTKIRESEKNDYSIADGYLRALTPFSAFCRPRFTNIVPSIENSTASIYMWGCSFFSSRFALTGLSYCWRIVSQLSALSRL